MRISEKQQFIFSQTIAMAWNANKSYDRNVVRDDADDDLYILDKQMIANSPYFISYLFHQLNQLWEQQRKQKRFHKD